MRMTWRDEEGGVHLNDCAGLYRAMERLADLEDAIDKAREVIQEAEDQQKEIEQNKLNLMNERAKSFDCDEEQKARIMKIRLAFSDLYDLVEECCVDPCGYLYQTEQALLKLEEAQFWATKAISRLKHKS